MTARRTEVAMKEIQLSVPNLDLDILENIRETIETGWVSTGGRFIREFEHMVTKYTGTSASKSTQSGTAALHLALHVLGIGEGDEVLCPTVSFIATANPIKYVGAEPVFMDCGDDLNIDPVKVEAFLEEECRFSDGVVINKKTNRKVKAIMVVHVFGNPADMEEITRIAEKFSLFVVEDAAQALGSYYTGGKFAGKHCGTIGDLGVYSFNANKIITCGNGGMVVSDNHQYLRDINFLGVQAKSDPLRYKHDNIGFNYRLTNIHAAYGVSQMKKLEQFVEVKRKNYQSYAEKIVDIPGLSLLPFNDDTRPNYWFYGLCIEKDVYGRDVESTLQHLLKHKIHSRPLWGLLHKQKPYVSSQAYRIENAYEIHSNILNIPCSTNLSEGDIQTIVSVLAKVK